MPSAGTGRAHLFSGATVNANLFDASVDMKIIDWRSHLMVNAGMPVLNARILATRRDVDVHHVVSLLERGCPPHLAMEIVE
jgi:hypothetical protein